ncbi:MAG: hypothetical protein R3E89_05275 [Thiolinea sp.]
MERSRFNSGGGDNVQYWHMVALPILWPSLLRTFALLFANAFGAVATAYALTGSSLSIVPIYCLRKSGAMCCGIRIWAMRWPSV